MIDYDTSLPLHYEYHLYFIISVPKENKCLLFNIKNLLENHYFVIVLK